MRSATYGQELNPLWSQSFTRFYIVFADSYATIQTMSPKNAAAVALGRKGGKARARRLTPAQRSEAARKAVEARWARLRMLTDDITKRSKKLLKTALRAEQRVSAPEGKARKVKN
jgi:hypothetical protein